MSTQLTCKAGPRQIRPGDLSAIARDLPAIAVAAGIVVARRPWRWQAGASTAVRVRVRRWQAKVNSEPVNAYPFFERRSPAQAGLHKIAERFYCSKLIFRVAKICWQETS
jgi:hypothetical protein